MDRGLDAPDHVTPGMKSTPGQGIQGLREGATPLCSCRADPETEGQGHCTTPHRVLRARCTIPRDTGVGGMRGRVRKHRVSAWPHTGKRETRGPKSGAPQLHGPCSVINMVIDVRCDSDKLTHCLASTPRAPWVGAGLGARDNTWGPRTTSHRVEHTPRGR